MARAAKYQVELTDEEVRQLKAIQRKKETSRMILRRCQILLDLDKNHGAILSRDQCAKSNAVSLATVANTLKKYAVGGVEEATSYKRSENSNNAMRKVDGRKRESLKSHVVRPQKGTQGGHCVFWRYVSVREHRTAVDWA